MVDYKDHIIKIPHLDGDIKIIPYFPSGTYMDVANKIKSNGWRMATASEINSLVYYVYENPEEASSFKALDGDISYSLREKGSFEYKIKRIQETSWFFPSNILISLPGKKGMFIVDYLDVDYSELGDKEDEFSGIEINEDFLKGKIIKEEEGIGYSKDGSIRFLEKIGYTKIELDSKRTSHTDLIKHPLIIGLFGKNYGEGVEQAKKLEQIISKHKEYHFIRTGTTYFDYKTAITKAPFALFGSSRLDINKMIFIFDYYENACSGKGVPVLLD